jgi:hypothetical protein
MTTKDDELEAFRAMLASKPIPKQEAESKVMPKAEEAPRCVIPLRAGSGTFLKQTEE